MKILAEEGFSTTDVGILRYSSSDGKPVRER
jgi:hypothetical protein